MVHLRSGNRDSQRPGLRTQGEEGKFSCQFTAYEANVQGIHEEDKLLDIEMKNKRIRTERGM
jgi:hypothetical protein